MWFVNTIQMSDSDYRMTFFFYNSFSIFKCCIKNFLLSSFIVLARDSCYGICGSSKEEGEDSVEMEYWKDQTSDVLEK